MSHNTEPGRAARRHPGPIIGIVVSLAVAAWAFVWWMSADPIAQDDISRIELPQAPAGGTDLAPPYPPPAGTPAAGSPPSP